MKSLEDLASEEKKRQSCYRRRVGVCAGAGCLSSGAGVVLEKFRALAEEKGLKEQVEIAPTGCMGPCNQGPVARVGGDNGAWMGNLAGMRLAALLFPALVALSLAAGCGSGCAHGNHHHATGSTYEEPPDYTNTCTCQENGEIDCTSGGSAELEADEAAL